MQLEESRTEIVRLARAATLASAALDDTRVIQGIVEDVFRETQASGHYSHSINWLDGYDDVSSNT